LAGFGASTSSRACVGVLMYTTPDEPESQAEHHQTAVGAQQQAIGISIPSVRAAVKLMTRGMDSAGKIPQGRAPWPSVPRTRNSRNLYCPVYRSRTMYRHRQRVVVHDIPTSAMATRTIVRMIASSANEAAGRSETGTQSLLPNRLLKL